MKRHWRGGVRTAHFDGAMVMRCQTRESKSDLTGSGQWKQAAFSQEHGPSLQHRNVSTPPSLRFRWSSIKSGGGPMSCSNKRTAVHDRPSAIVRPPMHTVPRSPRKLEEILCQEAAIGSQLLSMVAMRILLSWRIRVGPGLRHGRVASVSLRDKLRRLVSRGIPRA
jgi:hypothetical protein